jgi:membrane associated rhomboid family serine protease
VLAFAAATLGGAPFLDPASEHLARWGANIGPLTADGQPWRTATGAFAHFGLVHLLINMTALADLGRTAERLFGSGPFLAIALASGAIGGAVSVAWNPWVQSAGASGMVFGVLGALLAYGFLPDTRMPRHLVRLHGMVAAGFFAFTAIASLAGVGVDHAAHLGGLASGAALGAVLCRPLAEPRSRIGPARLALAAALAAGSFGIAAAQWRNVGPAWAEEQRFVAATRAYLDGEAARVAALRESHAKWRAGELSRAAHARDLREYARLLAATADDLHRYRVSPESPAAPRAAQEALSTVLRLRAQGVERRAVAIETGRADAAADADRLLAEADALWDRAACRERRSPLLRCSRAATAAGAN